MSSLPIFEPLPTRTRRDQVAQALRKAILAGQMPGGTQLVEGALATQFGVSRGLLREALRELIEGGLVINRPYAGTFVTALTVDQLCDVYEVRRVLEAQAYVRLWPRRDEAFRQELERRFDSMVTARRSGDLSEEIRAEFLFHGLVYERCGNHVMPALWEQMSQKLQLGFAICQVARVPKLDFQENHLRFMDVALGDDLSSMLAELDQHLQRGMATLNSTSGAPADPIGESPVQDDAGLNIHLQSLMLDGLPRCHADGASLDRDACVSR
jgi:DNA-binding GntR family transcriptional regulator